MQRTKHTMWRDNAKCATAILFCQQVGTDQPFNDLTCKAIACEGVGVELALRAVHRQAKHGTIHANRINLTFVRILELWGN